MDRLGRGRYVGLALFVVVGAVLASCSRAELAIEDSRSPVIAGAESASGDDGTAGDSVEAEGTDLGTVDGQSPEIVLSEADIEPALQAYDEFLRLRDAAYMAPDSDLVAIEAIAGAPVVSEIKDFWSRNEAFTEAGVGVNSRASKSNVVKAELDRNSVRIDDCVEMREDQQEDIQSPVRFIEQTAVLKPSDGGWVVDSIDVIRSGDISQTEFMSCVPQYHADRISVLVAGVGDATYEWKSDPERGVPDGLIAPFDERLAEESELTIELLNERYEGRYLSSVEEREVSVAGSDVGTGGWNFYVEHCTHYPDGEQWTDVASGDLVEDREPGLATRVGYRVLSTEQADGSWSDVIVWLTPVESPSPCWDEYGE